MFSINNINFADKGYYINLDSSVERKEQVENLIIKYNINDLNRFPALKDPFIQYSCTKSHLSVFQTALDENLDSIFIAEDDFIIHENLHAPYADKQVTFFDTIQKISEDLKNVEWDILQFGCNPKSNLIPVTENLAINYSSTGAWAYIIKKEAYKYILENSNYVRDYIAIDDYLPMMSKKGFVTLTTIPMSMYHSIGFESTLQPRGPVNYDTWINGNYDKFLYGNYVNKKFMERLIERYTTIVITGHYCENYLFYLRYLLHSLPDELKRCRFILHYDETSNDNLMERTNLNRFFRDESSELNVTLSYSFGGLISSVQNILEKVTTPYYIFLEHDWVFLKKDNIDFDGLVNAFNNNDFINAVWFSKDDNSMRGFDIAVDSEGITTPFEKESRVTETNLITACRWSNNPVMFRTDKMKDWFNNIIKNEHIGVIHQAQQNIEETMIPYYRNVISNNKWSDIKDEWGTFIYGDIDEGPYVGHTDASRRYQGGSKSGPEYNGEEYIKNNPL
jgi:GR25 family glycosyltransferase involved in LPS biosynthesis